MNIEKRPALSDGSAIFGKGIIGPSSEDAQYFNNRKESEMSPEQQLRARSLYMRAAKDIFMLVGQERSLDRESGRQLGKDLFALYQASADERAKINPNAVKDLINNEKDKWDEGRLKRVSETLDEVLPQLTNIRKQIFKPDLFDFTRKIAISADLNLALLAIYTAATVAAVVDGETQQRLMKFLNINPSYSILLLSFVANYLSLGVDAWQNVRLLNSRNIRNSPQLFATLTSNACDKFWPSQEKARDSATFFAPLILSFAQEAYFLPRVFTSEHGLAVLVTRNAVLTLVNLLQAVAEEFFLRKASGNKKPEEAPSTL